MPTHHGRVQTLRISSWTPWLIVALLAGGTAGWQIDRSPQPEQSRSSDNPRQSRAKMSTRVVHYVTPRQLIASNAMTDQNLADLEATGHDGVRRSWAELSGGEPVVLVFVKQGCPCNVEFDPYFRRVERLYRGSVRFAAVIDGNVKDALEYAEELKLPYPVLADPACDLIRRFGAENGGYVAVLAQDGTIDGFWPGCSADGLQDLGRRIARLAGIEERPLDLAGMPGPLITGCPFEL